LTAKERKARYDNILNANNKLCLIKNRGYSQRAVAKSRIFHDDEEKRIFEEQEAKEAVMNEFE
jgi:hypothetical protein